MASSPGTKSEVKCISSSPEIKSTINPNFATNIVESNKSELL